MFFIFFVFFVIFFGLIVVLNVMLNCFDVNVVIGFVLCDVFKDFFFVTLVKFSEFDAFVVFGGFFYEVMGDLIFFVFFDDDFEDEIEYWKDIFEFMGEEFVFENKAYV